MISRGCIFQSEACFSPGGPDTAVTVDRSRYKQVATNTNITYTRLPTGLWVHSLLTGYVNLGTVNSLDFTTSAFTIMAWVKITDLAANNYIFCRGQDNVEGYSLVVMLNGRLSIITNQLGVGQTSSSAVGYVGVNRYYFIVGTRSGASGLIYVNALNVNENFAAHVNPLTSTKSGRFGCYDLINNYLKGQISLMRIFNYALTPGQILQTFEKERSLFGV